MKYDFKFICDCHTHSEWSFDGKEPVDAMCQQAKKLGINVLTITDHCEMNGWNTPESSEFGDFSKLIPQSIAHLKESQKKHNNSDFKLLRGIELGQAMQDLKACDIALGLDDYDFVLASVHNVRDMEDFYWLEYTKEFAQEILFTYFNEVLEVVHWNRFDSLAHLTYPLRYIIGEHKIDINLKPYMSIIEEVFVTLIKNDKALEINTSGLRQKIGTTLPDENLLAFYKQLGGKYVTIGSDAHTTTDLGKGINEGLHLIKKLGFENITYFEKHQPILIPIEQK